MQIDWQEATTGNTRFAAFLLLARRYKTAVNIVIAKIPDEECDLTFGFLLYISNPAQENKLRRCRAAGIPVPALQQCFNVVGHFILACHIL